MDFIIDFILHIDHYMVEMVQQYHTWTYAILFAVIFCETGLVVTPFLPGDSLLFVGGAIAAVPSVPLDVNLLFLILFVAAVLGDSCNYMIGRFWENDCFIIRIPEYSSKVIWTRLMNFIKNTEGKQSS